MLTGNQHLKIKGKKKYFQHLQVNPIHSGRIWYWKEKLHSKSSKTEPNLRWLIGISLLEDVCFCSPQHTRSYVVRITSGHF